MSFTTTGLLVGLILGLALSLGGISAFLGTIVIGAIGFGVGRVLDGRVDLSQLSDRFGGGDDRR